VKYCLAGRACKQATHSLFLALDTDEADEVMLPDYAWTATSAPILTDELIVVTFVREFIPCWEEGNE
jgi:dTDP-4-amino-4,6-dideoxygalactose transaminase